MLEYFYKIKVAVYNKFISFSGRELLLDTLKDVSNTLLNHRNDRIFSLSAFLPNSTIMYENYYLKCFH